MDLTTRARDTRTLLGPPRRCSCCDPSAPGQERATAVLTFEVTGELPLEGTAVLRMLAPQQLTGTSSPIR